MFISTRIWGAMLWLACAAAQAQVSSYDGASGTLLIPSVQVGADVYTDVRLLNVGNFTFTLQAATQQVPPGRSVANYDLASSMLSLPAVKVGDETYLDVTLFNRGSYTFELRNATLLPAATRAAVADLARRGDALWATAVPVPGSQRLSVTDSCYANDGRTRANLIDFLDATPAEFQARDAYRIGQRTANLQVLARRLIVSSGLGGVREELDVQYDLVYTDGSTDNNVHTTLISGNSATVPGCALGQNGSDFRFLGNRQKVLTSARTLNLRDERYLIASGAAATPELQYRRNVQWAITDPMGNANYVIVSGPGPVARVGDVAYPFALKFISPRLLRSAPELAGKNGNFLNWQDDDSFRYCRSSGGTVPVAAIADCVAQGATDFALGITSATADAAADASFDALGFVPGGLYTFAVYNDDGWKTVNGQVGRTPIAIYTDVLDRLPYRFVDLAGATPAADKFPRLSFGGQTVVQVRNDLVSAAPTPISASWTALGALPDAAVFRTFELWEYFQGAKVGNPGTAFYPAYRSIIFQYPGSTASSIGSWPVGARPATMSSKNYGEFMLYQIDRNGRQIESRVSFN